MKPFVLCLVFLAACSQSAGASGFRETLEAHLQAIQTRDLAAYEATITGGDSLTLIFPDGRLIETRAEVMDFHRDWFADETWSMSFTPVRVIEGAELSTALYRTRFETTLENGDPYWSESYLALTFALEDGQWRLTHDQNTRIRTSQDDT